MSQQGKLKRYLLILERLQHAPTLAELSEHLSDEGTELPYVSQCRKKHAPQAAFLPRSTSYHKPEGMSFRYSTIAPILAALACPAQGYLTNDPVWSEHSICAVPYPCIATDTYTYRTVGDSLVDGHIWTKVARQGLITSSWQNPPPPNPDCQGTTSYGLEWFGLSLIRQQGRQLRIWDGSSDQLLYEFDLQVGDTLPITWNNWNPDITVLAVDSVLIGTEMRARYELGNSWAQYLVEGVGTSHGLLAPVSDFFDCGYALDCFGLGAQGYYSDHGPCDIVMHVPEKAGKTTLSAAPVPTMDAVTVRGTHEGEAYTVRDQWSRIVLRGETRQDATRIDLSTLPSGAYAVLIDRSVLRVVVLRH